MTQQISADYKLQRQSVIGVCIPCYNEEKSIAKIILQLRGLVDRVIVCDDGSVDMTADIARALGCEVITHRRNMGKGAALRSLFLAARDSNIDVLVTVDGDGQHNLLDIPKLIEPVLKGECDIAIGSRFCASANENTMPRYREFGSKLLNSLIRRSTKLSAKDTQSGFRAYSRDAIMKITPGEQGIAVDTEILVLAQDKGMRITEVPTTIEYDGLDTSTYHPISHSLQVVGGTMKFVSLRHPLTFYGIASLIFMIISLISGGWSVYYYETVGRVPFGPALLAASTFIVSLILAAIAIILFSLTTLVREEM